MKKIALVLIASFCAIASFSQIGKGNWEVGGSGHMTWSTQDFDGDKYHYNNFAISPRIGKFICEGFVLGLNLEFVSERYHINDDDPYKYNSFNTGLFARYYIGRNGQKHNIFAEGSFDFGGS
ncbi:MAG TPA: hypothetical protein VLJ68_03675, partial [Chitinophagaceae bacterium]|nr:hypothetical protein [Chitinophagaceae bacterium]